MMRSVLHLTVLSMMFVIVGGCPQNNPGSGTGDETMTLRTTAPETAVQGETVTLNVRLPDGVDATQLLIRWRQTLGRAVEITNSDSLNASFIAPSLSLNQTLHFRVDVQTASGAVFSETVTIKIEEDPDYKSPSSGSDDETQPVVRILTSKGTITVKLYTNEAPLTVNNFLRYVDDGFYEDVIFHRVIADFMIQGGGYDTELVKKETRPSILDESEDGRSNIRGTISMAHQADPDTGMSQFFINVKNNTHLDYDNPSTSEPDDGNKHTVFGEVTDGMDVVDEISEVETESRGGMSDVPVENVVIRRIERIATEISSSDDDDKDSDDDDDDSGSGILQSGS